MADYEYHKLKAQLAILMDVAKEYPASTIANAINQIKARIRLYESKQEQ